MNANRQQQEQLQESNEASTQQMEQQMRQSPGSVTQQQIDNKVSGALSRRWHCTVPSNVHTTLLMSKERKHSAVTYGKHDKGRTRASDIVPTGSHESKSLSSTSTGVRHSVLFAVAHRDCFIDCKALEGSGI